MGFGNDAADEAAQISREELAFQKEVYARHLAIFGDIEESVADHYRNMSPMAYAGKMAGAFQQEYQKAKSNVQKELARRGLNGSNIGLFMTQNMELQAAQTKAGIYANADDYVAQQRNAFVRGGDTARGQNFAARSAAAQNASSIMMQNAHFKWNQFSSVLNAGAAMATPGIDAYAKSQFGG